MEKEIYKTARKMKLDVHTIMDVGAFVGSSCLQFHSWFPRAEIYAIEGCPKNFSVLIKNIKCTPIKPFNQVISNVNEEVSFYTTQVKLPRKHKGASSRSNSVYKAFVGGVNKKYLEELTVPGKTITQFCHDYGIDSIDILKMNCEGSEYDILKGPIEFAKNVKLLAVQFHGERRPFTHRNFLAQQREIHTVLSSYGFKCVLTKGSHPKHVIKLWVNI